MALRVVVLWGWRRLLTAFIAGVASVLALPPFHFLPVLFVTFPVLVWLLDGVASDKGRLRALATSALVGWAFGFGYFLAGLHWLGFAFLVEADLFAWMIPIALTVLPAGLAVFAGLTCALARAFWAPGFARVLALAACWAGVEWIRARIFTGLPWNNVGYAASGSDGLMQSLSYFGLFGLSFFVVFLAACPAVTAGEFDSDEGRPPWWRWRGPAAGLLVLSVLWGGGYFRLSTATTTFHDAVRLRIVQPNIPQTEKWKPENRSSIFARFLEMSNTATSPDAMGIADIKLLIWPESALPFLLEENGNARAALAALLPPSTTLITGALHRAPPVKSSGRRRPAMHNSILVVDGEGTITSRYDKFHLVPFGEYLPFRNMLERWGWQKLVTVPAGFLPGGRPKSMVIKGAPSVLPLICYEAIFPRYAFHNPRPGWLLNVTNDAWFGRSIGPYQHFEQARARAIEQGLPMVRAANTGISAVVDPYGRIVRAIGLNRRGVIDTLLPKPLNPTVYAVFGDWVLVLILVFAAAFNATLAMRSRRRRDVRHNPR